MPWLSGQPLYRVHADFPADLEFARQACAQGSGYRVGTADEAPRVSWSFEHDPDRLQPKPVCCTSTTNALPPSAWPPPAAWPAAGAAPSLSGWRTQA